VIEIYATALVLKSKVKFFGSTAPLMEKNMNLIFVGWVERRPNPTLGVG
jgi:hypothetical protein